MAEPHRGILSLIALVLLASSLVHVVSGQDDELGAPPPSSNDDPSVGDPDPTKDVPVPSPGTSPTPGLDIQPPSEDENPAPKSADGDAPSPSNEALSPNPDEDSPAPDPSSAESPRNINPIDGVPGAAPDSPPDAPNPADSPTSPSGISRTIKWCTVSDGEQEFCKGVVAELEGIVTDPPGDYGWDCIKQADAFGCMRAIKEGAADLVTLEAGLAYVAFTSYTMKAVMGEFYKSGESVPATYSSVAIVRRSLCERNKGLKLRDFRGKSSCHSGYRTAAGWDIPLSTLNNLGLVRPMVNDNKPADVAMVEKFFGKSCSAGDTRNSTLCSSCEEMCDASLYIAGDLGALRCLANGGDIAFVRAGLLPDFQCRGDRNRECGLGLDKLDMREFEVLCEGTGGCASPSAAGCKLGTVVGHAVMVQNQLDSDVVNHILNTLEGIKPGSFFNETSPYDYLFSAMARGVKRLQPGMLTREYLSSQGSDAGLAGNLTSDILLGYSGAPERPRRVGILTLVIAILPFLLSCFAG